MTTNLDLLKTIYNATISLPIKKKINPDYKKLEFVCQYYGNEHYCKLNEKVTYFSYVLNKTTSTNMKFSYQIDLYKTEPSKFFGFLINNERYILRVQISEPTKF